MTEFILKSVGSLLVFIMISGLMGSLVWPLFKDLFRLSLSLFGLL